MSHLTSVGAQLGAAVHQSTPLSATGLHERLFSRLFRGLVYAQIWEDPAVDMAALGIRADDNIVCIASGGCNAMCYLTAGPKSITAVDLSPAHVALLRLKLAAARHLPDHASFYDFFGRADLASNIAMFDRHIVPNLDPLSRAYWNGRPLGRRRITMFARGFYRFGLLGRFIGFAHLLARLASVDLRAVLGAASLAEQQRIFDDRIAPAFDLPLIRFLARRRALMFGLGIPPAQYERLASDCNGDVIPVLRERVRKLFCDFPVQRNYFAWQACCRAHATAEPRSVPLYLERRHFESLRAGAGRVRVLNRSLTDHLGDVPDRSLDCYALLDAQDWMMRQQLDALWGQITRTAAPGARVIFRTGGRADILPGLVSPALLAQWQYDHSGSARGFAADRSAVYGGFHLYRRRP